MKICANNVINSTLFPEEQTPFGKADTDINDSVLNLFDLYKEHSQTINLERIELFSFLLRNLLFGITREEITLVLKSQFNNKYFLNEVLSNVTYRLCINSDNNDILDQTLITSNKDAIEIDIIASRMFINVVQSDTTYNQYQMNNLVYQILKIDLLSQEPNRVFETKKIVKIFDLVKNQYVCLIDQNGFEWHKKYISNIKLLPGTVITDYQLKYDNHLLGTEYINGYYKSTKSSVQQSFTITHIKNKKFHVIDIIKNNGFQLQITVLDEKSDGKFALDILNLDAETIDNLVKNEFNPNPLIKINSNHKIIYFKILVPYTINDSKRRYHKKYAYDIDNNRVLFDGFFDEKAWDDIGEIEKIGQSDSAKKCIVHTNNLRNLVNFKTYMRCNVNTFEDSGSIIKNIYDLSNELICREEINSDNKKYRCIYDMENNRTHRIVFENKRINSFTFYTEKYNYELNDDTLTERSGSHITCIFDNASKQFSTNENNYKPDFIDQIIMNLLLDLQKKYINTDNFMYSNEQPKKETINYHGYQLYISYDIEIGNSIFSHPFHKPAKNIFCEISNENTSEKSSIKYENKNLVRKKSEYIDNRSNIVVRTRAATIPRSYGQIGYKLCLTLNKEFCVVELLILNDAKVIYSRTHDKYRCNKCYIKKITNEKTGLEENRAYSFVATNQMIYAVNTIIEIDNFDITPYGCRNGIHYHNNKLALTQWKEFALFDLDPRKFSFFSTNGQPYNNTINYTEPNVNVTVVDEDKELDDIIIEDITEIISDPSEIIINNDNSNQNNIDSTNEINIDDPFQFENWNKIDWDEIEWTELDKPIPRLEAWNLTEDELRLKEIHREDFFEISLEDISTKYGIN